jgi:phage terminase small subunit
MSEPLILPPVPAIAPKRDLRKDAKGLTRRQRALVDTLVATGCSITEAAHRSGYAEGEAGRVAASRTLRLPQVQAYMRTLIEGATLTRAAKAGHVIETLMTSARSEYVQLEAAKDVLTRARIGESDQAVGAPVSIVFNLG